MCGLVAVFGSVFKKEEDLFQNMLVVDQLRGTHSTGVFGVERHNKGDSLIKVVGGPENLFDSKRFSSLMAKTNRVLMGHNRFATKGSINVANAHPFDMGEIVGMHNGSLTSYSDLDGFKDFDVDSQVLYNHINNNGLQDAVNNCFGAMALIWWDRETECMNLYRNDQRPLWVAYSKDKRTCMVASEWWMISGLASRQSIELTSDGPMVFPEKMHYSWHIPGGIVKELEKPEARKVERKTFSAPPSGNVFQQHQQHQRSQQPGVNSQHHPRQQPALTLLPKSNNRPSFPGPEKNIYHGKHDKLLAEAHTFEYIGPVTIRGVDYQIHCALDPNFADVEFLTVASAMTGAGVKLEPGKMYVAKVVGSMPHEKGGVDYYFLQPSSFRQIGEDPFKSPEQEPGEAELAAADAEEGTAEPFLTYRAGDGSFVGKEEWVRRHGKCDCCTGYVDPAEAVQVVSFSDYKPSFVCGVCAADDQTMQYYQVPGGNNRSHVH